MNPMMQARSRVRRGFTLIEVVVSVVIIGLIAGVALPGIAGYIAMQRDQTTADTFKSLEFSMTNQNTVLGRLGFINVVITTGATPAAGYPSALSQLVNVITTAQTHCSGAVYSATDVTNWAKGAPYSGLLIAAGQGVSTPLGMIQDAIVKGSGNTAGFIELRLDQVAQQDATNLDLLIDGAADATTGQLRYVASATAGLFLVKYLLPASYGC
jgi:prepilin-type N-terminal cleavage/methylation domain-containing protein